MIKGESEYRDNDRTKVLVITLVVVVGAMTMTIMGYLLLQMFEQIGDGDPYRQSFTYSVAGTYEEGGYVIECTGSGTSEYVDENKNYKDYVFKFDVKKGDGTVGFRTLLICDSDGTPLDGVFTKISDGSSGIQIWELSEDGFTYRYHIGDYCRVAVLEITGNGYNLTATVAE